jgi:hypothetical protein
MDPWKADNVVVTRARTWYDEEPWLVSYWNRAAEKFRQLSATAGESK